VHGTIRRVKKILMPLAAAGALVILAGCGGNDDAGKPASNKSSTPAAVALTQAEFAPKVQAALQSKGTFRVVTVTTDEGKPATFTTDVKLTGKQADVLGTGDGSTVVRVGDQLYGKGEGITDDSSKPWVKFDPATKDPMAGLSGVLIKVLEGQTSTHELIGGAAYASSFTSAPGAAVGGAPTTAYTMTVDLPKATAAKALGGYITAEMVAEEKLTELTAKVSLDQDSLPRKIEFQVGTSTVVADFSNFGTPVTIAAPSAAEIA
jgi:hypothetical protein